MDAAGTAVAPSIDIDLYAAQHLAEPWDVLAQIREAGQIVWNRQGFWMSAHDKVCRQILTQPDMLGQEGLISSLFSRLPDFSIVRPVTFGNFSLRGPTSVVIARA